MPSGIKKILILGKTRERNKDRQKLLVNREEKSSERVREKMGMKKRMGNVHRKNWEQIQNKRKLMDK